MKYLIIKIDYNLFNDYNQSLIIIKLFNKQAILIAKILALYLLFTIISISYIVNIFDGPIRKKS